MGITIFINKDVLVGIVGAFVVGLLGWKALDVADSIWGSKDTADPRIPPTT